MLDHSTCIQLVRGYLYTENTSKHECLEFLKSLFLRQKPGIIPFSAPLNVYSLVVLDEFFTVVTGRNLLDKLLDLDNAQEYDVSLYGCSGPSFRVGIVPKDVIDHIYIEFSWLQPKTISLKYTGIVS